MATGARVLVTDAQDHCGLAVIRCLAASGHRVTGASLIPRAVGLWSRGCTSKRVLPDPAESLAEFTDALARLLQTERHDVVIACRDATVCAISARREALDSTVRTGLPDRASVLRAMDRQSLAARATDVGLPAPEQHLCTTNGEALDRANDLGWPIVVKPVLASFTEHDQVLRFPSSVVADEEALLRIVDPLGTCLIQRHVNGDVLSFGGVATEAGLLGAVVSRYLRTWPPGGGQSSLTETIVPPPGLIERVQDLVKALGWTGIFELELIQTGAGTIHAIDFNPRPYGSLALARAAGVPLSTIWCRWLITGDAPNPAWARPGVRFRYEQRELLNLVQSIRDREYQAATAILRPRRGTAHAAFALTDPLPGVLSLASAVRHLPHGV